MSDGFSTAGDGGTGVDLAECGGLAVDGVVTGGDIAPAVCEVDKFAGLRGTFEFPREPPRLVRLPPRELLLC